jgi:hypothetical protein
MHIYCFPKIRKLEKPTMKRQKGRKSRTFRVFGFDDAHTNRKQPITGWVGVEGLDLMITEHRKLA